MYCCGSREVARLLAEGGKDYPEFALPGDATLYAPDRPADVVHIDLDLALDFEAEVLRGTVTTTFAALFEEVRDIAFDAAELRVESVTLAGSGAALRFWMGEEKLHVALDRPYRHGETFAVSVGYSATPRAGFAFVKPDPGDPDLPTQSWTIGETMYHHWWFPCHDFPNDRATTSLRATVPGRFFALSNGRMEGVTENADGTKTYAWRMDVPYPAYLVTLVAGEFAELPDRWRDLPVNYYVPKGREDDGRRMMGKTPRMIAFYSDRFGVDYPYPEYAQVVVHKYLGAMENASATTHTYRLLADERASLDFSPEPTVAHELVHQWHGDLIAIRDWAHTWLKEGFATYFERCWMQHDKGEDEFRLHMGQEQHGYLAADARGRRPIVYGVTRKNADELFDPHFYDKAACVLHMLRHVVGEEPFWRGIQLYTRRNAGREVITADFERAMEEATGRSLALFFEQWLYKAGHPAFKVRYAWDDGQKLAKLTVEQTQKRDEQTPLFATPIDVGFLVPEEDSAGDAAGQLVTFRVTLEEEKQTFYFPLARRPLSVRFDQGGWLLKTLDFERPSELLRHQLRHDPDVLGRIEAAEALGKLGDRQSVEALEAALYAEPFWGVQASIAEAIARQRDGRALDALLGALGRIEHPKVRRAIVEGLGGFRAPEQADLAERAAEALQRILRAGERSYYVEAAAARSLGKTRTPGAFEALLAKVEAPSWLEIIRGGVFGGLGELGEARGADVLAAWLTDRTKPMDARANAAAGFIALANTKRIDGGEAQTRAVEALIAALDDPWEWTVRYAISALAAWGDARAIPALERYQQRSVDERLVRACRVAIRRIQQGKGERDEVRKLRGDLDELKAQNRALLDRVGELEARLGARNGERS